MSCMLAGCAAATGGILHPDASQDGGEVACPGCQPVGREELPLKHSPSECTPAIVVPTRRFEATLDPTKVMCAAATYGAGCTCWVADQARYKVMTCKARQAAGLLSRDVPEVAGNHDDIRQGALPLLIQPQPLRAWATKLERSFSRIRSRLARVFGLTSAMLGRGG